MTDFRTPPEPTASEWSGTIVGVANAVTRTRGPVPADRHLDVRKCEHFVELARRALEGEICHIHDAVIHGVRVRLFTDSRHVSDFWTRHWHGPQDWRELTGDVPAAKPGLTIYVAGQAGGGEAFACACPPRQTVVVLGTTWYGTVRDETLAALQPILADELGALLVRGSATATGGQATLAIGMGHTTAAFDAMESAAARFIADEAVIVRFAYKRRAGGWVIPTAAGPATGWKALDWIDHVASDPDARVRGVTDDGTPIELELEDLDRAERAAFAYPGERGAYIRTSLVLRHPAQAWTFVRSAVENAPESAGSSGEIDDLARTVATSGEAAGRSYFTGLPPAKAREIVGRLADFEGTRALIDPAMAFGRTRVVRRPWSPTPVATIAQLAAVPTPEGEAAAALTRRLHAMTKVVEGLPGAPVRAH